MMQQPVTGKLIANECIPLLLLSQLLPLTVKIDPLYS